MSDNRIISFLHSVNQLDRKWKNLTADQKRTVLEQLNGEVDVIAALKAIRQAKRSVR